MDFTAILKFLPYISGLVQMSPDVKKWIDTGTSVIAELQKDKPNMIPLLEQIGKNLFPALTTQVHAVSAAAQAIFDPHGTQWLQTSLNTLMDAKLDVDGGYGKLTKAAVEAFQKAHQPEAGPVDGWAGRVTEAVIVAELAKRPAA